ncbi:LysM domain-containing protein [Litoribacillus peritrichatus]
MSGLYICQNGDTLESVCNSSNNQNLTSDLKSLNPHLSPSSNLRSGQAIILPGKTNEVGSASQRFLLQSSPSSIQNLSKITETMTGHQALALAEVSERLGLRDIAPDLNTFGGGGLGAATARASSFLMALKKYDDALAEYHGFKNHRAAPNTLSMAKLKVANAFKEMQIKFNNETLNFFNKYPAKMESYTIARPGRPVIMANRTIPITTSSGATSLAKFARYGKGLGYGMVALDGYFRYQAVDQMRLNGGNWQREAWAQGVGMLAGLGIGAYSFAFLLGPFGIVLGIILAGAVAVISDKLIVSSTRHIYDQIAY